MKKLFLLCMSPVAPHWQLDLSPPSGAEVLLLSWCPGWDDHDKGVPRDVATIIAKTLTANAKIGFLSSEPGKPAGPTTQYSDVAFNPIERIHAKIKHEPVQVKLITTVDPNVACQIFYDGSFSWQMQGQIAFLLPTASNPPLLDRKGLGMLMESGWKQALARLGLQHLLGVMRPGVDGDVAGIWSFDKAFTHALLAGLENEARREGYEFQLVSEETFMTLLAD